MPRDRLQGVRTARRVEPAAGRQCRTYPPTVRDDGRDQHLGTGCRRARAASARCRHRDRRPRGDRAAAMAASRSAAEPGVRTPRPRRAAPGRPGCCRRAARSAARGPGAAAGAGPCCGPPRCRPPWTRRSRRGSVRRLLRTESRAGSGEVVAVGRRSAARSGGPRRRHGRRVGHREPLRRSRAAPQSLRGGQHDCHVPGPARRLRPTGGRGPWRDGSRGWRGRHGCACAAGSRGSSRAGGCSAGRCACSRQALRFRTPPRDGIAGVVWWSRPPRR